METTDFRHNEDLRSIFRILRRIEDRLEDTNRRITKMAIEQATFDTDLAALVASIGTLTDAVDAFIAANPAVDLTAEDQAVVDASAAVAAELAKIAPAPPVTS